MFSQTQPEDPKAPPGASVEPTREALLAALAERDEAIAQQASAAEVLQIINASEGDLAPVLEAIVERAMRLCGASSGGMWLLDGDRVRPVGARKVPEAYLEFLNREPLSLSQVFDSAIEEQPFRHIADLSATKAYRNGAPLVVACVDLGGVRTFLSVPLREDGATAGIINLFRDEIQPFTDRQIALVQSFAVQAEIAIANARHIKETREALERQTASSEILRVISQSPTDARPVFERIVETAKHVLHCETAVVLLCEGDVFVTAAAWIGEGRVADVGRTRVPIDPDANFPSRAIVQKKVVHLPDWSLIELPEHERKMRERWGFNSALYLPLLREGECIGALGLVGSRPNSFGPSEIAQAVSFRDQALIAIENARLFNETQEALEQQRASADILGVIGNSVDDVQPVFEKILHSVQHLFGADERIVFLMSEDGLLHIGAIHGSNAERARAAYPMPLDSTTSAIAIRERRLVSFADVFNDPDVPDGTRESARRIGRNYSVAVAPMLWEGRGIGSIVVMRLSMQPFTEKEGALLRTFADQAVIAIQNARLFRETREALERQTATAEILKVIASSPSDVQPVFDAIARSATKLSEAANSGVFQFRDGLIQLVGHYNVSAQQLSLNLLTFPTPPHRGILAGRAILDRAVTHIPDIAADPEYTAGAMVKAGYRSALSVPMLLHGEPIGVINVMREEARPFSAPQIDLLKTFADQAVIAIENARLFRETQEALEQQKASAEILSVISQSVADPQPVFDKILESCKQLFDGDELDVLLIDDEGLLQVAAYLGTARDTIMATFPAPWEITPAGRAIRERRVANYSDVLNNPDTPPVLRKVGKIVGYHSVAFAPMVWEDKGIGAVGVARSRGAFTEKEMALLQTFADQAVIAIQNARMFEEVQAKTRDLTEALQQQTATADVLKVISRSAFDLQAVLDTLVRSASELCDAASGVIYLQEGEAFHLKADSGLNEDLVRYLRENPQKPGRGSGGGRVLLTGEVQNIADIHADQDYDPDLKAAATHSRALLGVPLMRNQAIFGAIVLTRPQPGLFSQRHVAIVQTFADQAVIAVENVRLFDEVQARTKELAASLADLRKAQDRLVQSEKLASLGQLTAGIAHEIKNPLNFINNFSALSRELIGELRGLLAKAPLDDASREDADDLIGMIDANLDKVVNHGGRADSIVKNMLLHSREGSGERTSVNINAMVEEALNLGYHGARAEKPDFNVIIMRSLDANAGAAELYAQEMTRVLLNLISNAFYATTKRKQRDGSETYEPTITASTRDLGHSVEIAIRDNGTGMPDEVKAKMFNPFFTTKPAGEGTGLGLSLSHDIVVKQHGGTIEISTEPRAYTQFTIVLPRARAAP